MYKRAPRASYQLAKRQRCNCPTPSFGAKAGDYLQKAGMSALKSWTGLGDYQVSTNSLITGAPAGSNPSMTFGERSVRIKFKEYVGDVFTHPTEAGKFYQQQYALNPGLLDNFQWLAPIAVQYQQWKPKGILFEFLSTSGDITTSQALGKVIIASDYNTTTLSTAFSNQAEMLAEAYAQESVPTKNMIHGIECDPSERTRQIYFVRAGAIPTTASLGDFDLCQTTVATVGGPSANTNLGSLWIHYDIEFYKNELFAGVKNNDLAIREWRSDTMVGFGTLPVKACQGKPWNGTGSRGAGAPRVGVIGEDFVLGNDTIQFPRWAKVGTAWRIMMYIKAPADTNSVSGIGYTATSGSISLLSAITSPTAVITSRTSFGQYDFIVTKNTPGEPLIIQVNHLNIPTDANDVYLIVCSIPSYFDNKLG